MKTRFLILLGTFLCVFTTTTFAQDDEFFTGLEFNSAMYEATPAPPLMMSRAYESMPSSYSLKKYCPIPKNQGSQGSCVGWSSTYAARTILHAKANNMTDAASITNIAYSPSYVYNQIKLSDDCSRGSYIGSAMEVLSKQGAPLLSDHPYVCNQTITTNVKTKASQHKIQTYRRLSNTGGNTLDAIKKSLSEGNPVVIGMAIYSSFSYAKGVWNGTQDNYRGGHAMTIIGYDNSKYGGAFEVMNSWGSTWGNGGFIWVRYNDMTTNCKEYYEMVGFAAPEPDVNDPEPIAQVDMKGAIKFVKDDNSTMYASLSTSATRDFNIVKKQGQSASESTYKLNNSQKSGTMFRLYISNEKPAYVYIIGYGTSSGKVQALYPFTGFSAYLGYKKNDIAIPGEDYYIQLDENIGKDYLCVLYSKRPLDAKGIANQIQNTDGAFSDRVKTVLQTKLVDGKNVSFERNKIEFEAKSNGRTVIPIIVEFDHI